MIRYTMAMIAGFALTAPALAQDANHIRIDGQIYDLRTLGAPPDAGEARAARHAREQYEDQNSGIVTRGTPHPYSRPILHRYKKVNCCFTSADENPRSMHQLWRCRVRKLTDCIGNSKPSCRPDAVTILREFVRVGHFPASPRRHSQKLAARLIEQASTGAA